MKIQISQMWSCRVKIEAERTDRCQTHENSRPDELAPIAAVVLPTVPRSGCVEDVKALCLALTYGQSLARSVQDVISHHENQNRIQT